VTRAEAALFPMRAVTRETGLSPDVVRAWERRYNAIAPARTAGNARRYSSADVARLARLKRAVDAGHSISSVAGLSDDELAALVERAEAAQASGPSELVERYLAAVARFDRAGAESLLARGAQLASMRETVLSIVAPILREVGERWLAGSFSVAQEHLVTAQVRALVGTLLRTANVAAGAPRVLVGAPQGQLHEVGAMVAAVLAVERGVEPIYLGPDVPWAELAPAAHAARAGLVVLSMVLLPSGAAERNEHRELTRLAKATELWVGAPVEHPAARVEGLHAFHDYESFELALAHRFAR
jgi:DNA-binding transcriptional MerR regulator